MDWNNPPLWFVILVIVVFPLVLIGGFMLRAYLTSRPLFKLWGSFSVYGPKELKPLVSEDMLDAMLYEFSRLMTGQGLFAYSQLKEHIGTIRCDLSAEKLEAPGRLAGIKAKEEGKEPPKYNGLTYSAHHIGVACDTDFRDAQGNVQLYRTALLYELLNACLWKLECYEMAYAEGGLNPDEEFHWRWLKDVDNDGDVDADDARAFKEKRAVYDEAFGAVTVRMGIKFKPEAS
jgi:hypothetical protein